MQEMSLSRRETGDGSRLRRAGALPIRWGSVLALVALLLAPAASSDDKNEELLAAVRKGDAAAVKALLDQGADVNAKSPYGATGLFFAADRGHAGIVKILLERGADVNVKDTFYGATALTWAVSKQRVEVVKLLLEKGASGVDAVLMAGAGQGNLELVKLALARGGLKPENLTAALAAATRNNRTETAELLKQAGAQPPKEFAVDAETLASYAGSYRGETGDLLRLQVVDGKLTGGPAGQKPFPLTATDKTTFQVAELPGVTLQFTIEDGKVVGATLRQGNNTSMYKKAAAP